MAESLSTSDNISDEEFDVESDVMPDASTTLDRLKEFSFYLVETVELQLLFFLKLLEERDVPNKSNSIYTTAFSKLFTALPKVGSALGNGLAKGEIVILDKIDKKNSRTLADLVYYFSDHNEDIRNVLIESSIDIFFSFEQQFMKLTCNGGPKRAMQKLAKDASDRIFNYLLETEQSKNITPMEISKGVLLGDSKRNRVGIREGKTVMKDETKWKTCKLYRSTGIVIVEEKLFFKNASCKTEKYGHRRLFPWENPEDIKQTWEPESGFEVSNYRLVTRGDLSKTVKDYIMTKDKFEKAKLERENYNKEALEDRQIKHDEVVNMFQEHFKELLEELQRQYKLTVENHRESQNFSTQGKENELHQKLEEIKKSIDDTKILIEHSESSRKDVVVQNEPAVQNMDNSEIRNQIIEVAKEALRKNDPGPKIKNEVKRFLRRF